jgi:hypothetical protein
MSDKIEIGRGQLGRLVEHSEGKDEESVVAILRFLCDSPHLCRLSTEGLVPWASIERIGRMLVIWEQ